MSAHRSLKAANFPKKIRNMSNQRRAKLGINENNRIIAMEAARKSAAAVSRGTSFNTR